jgi:hypothetical protein
MGPRAPGALETQHPAHHAVIAKGVIQRAADVHRQHGE